MARSKTTDTVENVQAEGDAVADQVMDQQEADAQGSGQNPSSQLPKEEAEQNRQDVDVDISKPHSMTPEEIKATQAATSGGVAGTVDKSAED